MENGLQLEGKHELHLAIAFFLTHGLLDGERHDSVWI